MYSTRSTIVKFTGRGLWGILYAFLKTIYETEKEGWKETRK